MNKHATAVKKDLCSYKILLSKLANRMFAGIFAILLSCNTTHALTPVPTSNILTDDNSSISYVEFYQPQPQSLSIEQIQQPQHSSQFKKIGDNPNHFLGIKGTYWLRFSLTNNGNNLVRLWLESGDSKLESMSFYQFNDTDSGRKQAHNSYSLSKLLLRDQLNILAFELPPGTTRQYFLHVFEPTTSPLIPKIYTDQTHLSNSLNIRLYQGLILGSLLVLLVYMLTNYFSFRDKIRLYLFALLLSSAAHVYINMGLLAQTTKYPLDLTSFFSAAITTLLAITGSLFLRKLLDTPKRNPLIDKLLLVSVWVSLLALTSNLLTPAISDHIIVNIMIMMSALGITAAISQVKAGHKIAIFPLAGGLVFLLPLCVIYLLPTNSFSILQANNTFNVALALQAIVYAMGLTYKTSESMAAATTEISRLKNHQHQSQQLLNISNFGNWYWDVESNDYFMSENVYKILPLTFFDTENAINKVFKKIDPIGKARLSRAFLKAKNTGTGFQCEFKLTDENDNYRYFLVNGDFEKKPTEEKTSKLLGTLQDITGYKESNMAYKEQEVRWREITDSTFESVLIFQNEKIVDANSASEHLFGYKPEQLIGTNGNLLFGESQLSSLPLNSSSSHEHVGEFTLKHSDGNDIHVEVRTRSGTFNEESVQTLAIRDVSQYKKQEEQLRKLGYTDNLTGLYNRALFQDHLQLAIDKAQRIPQKHALLYIDLDQFKHVNDSLGHDVGDELLKEVGKRLMKRVRNVDTVARLGGDEFAILIEDIIAPYNAAKVADGVIEVMSDEIVIEDYRLQVSPSIGIAIFPTDGDNGGELLRKADTAMYHAKDQGRNNYQFYTEELHHKIVRRMNLESELRVAIERGELFLNYQPQVSLETGFIIGAEALLRWKSSKYGVVSPGEFISIAEENGLIWSIGEFVLKQACEQAVPWIAENSSFESIAVNISGIQFNNSDLVDTIKKVLKDSQLPAKNLELEITEGAIIDNADEAIKIMKQLKEIGVKLSLDDFGTGYSSLSYLRRFPVDSLKIDRSFVAEIVSDKSGLIIAENIVNLAHGLKLNVVAEGVETTEQLNIIRAMKCDELQGYIFSTPLSANDLSTAITKEENLYEIVENLA